MTWRACAAQGPTPGLLRGAAWVVAGLALATGGAFAAEGAKSGASEVIFLAMVVGRLLGEAMNRIGQPSVMGMLLGGILLGPSMLGALWPDLQHALFPKTAEQKAMLDGVSQFGILLLLLLTGMETDLKLVGKVGKAALSVSLTGVAVPVLCGFALGQFMPEALLPHPDQRLLTSLFLGTALSISSIKIVAAVVREMGFTRRDLGQIIVASAICEDSIGWVIIAITLSLAQSGSVDLLDVGKAVLGTAAFLIASFTIGRPLVFFLIRWTNDNFKSDFPVITTILVIMGLMALTTHFIGVHTVLGAFVAGVLIGESPILTKHIDEQLRGLLFDIEITPLSTALGTLLGTSRPSPWLPPRRRRARAHIWSWSRCCGDRAPSAPVADCGTSATAWSQSRAVDHASASRQCRHACATATTWIERP